MQTFGESRALDRPLRGAWVRGSARVVANAGARRDRWLACFAFFLLIVAWDAALRLDDGLEIWGVGFEQASLAHEVPQSVSLPR
jgi:hypothetical protein